MKVNDRAFKCLHSSELTTVIFPFSPLFSLPVAHPCVSLSHIRTFIHVVIIRFSLLHKHTFELKWDSLSPLSSCVLHTAYTNEIWRTKEEMKSICHTTSHVFTSILRLCFQVLSIFTFSFPLSHTPSVSSLFDDKSVVRMILHIYSAFTELLNFQPPQLVLISTNMSNRTSLKSALELSKWKWRPAPSQLLTLCSTSMKNWRSCDCITLWETARWTIYRRWKRALQNCVNDGGISHPSRRRQLLNRWKIARFHHTTAATSWLIFRIVR